MERVSFSRNVTLVQLMLNVYYFFSTPATHILANRITHQLSAKTLHLAGFDWLTGEAINNSEQYRYGDCETVSVTLRTIVGRT